MADEIIASFKVGQDEISKALQKQLNLTNQNIQATKKREGQDDQTTKSEIDNVKKKESAVQKSNTKLESSFKRLGAQIALVFGTREILQFGQEAVRLAGIVEGVRAAFNKLNGVSLSELRKATRGTVTDLELMKAAVRAENFKVPLEKLATFFEFATKRSAQTGESVDYLVNSIIDGIGRKSSLVLDNLGISATELQSEIKKTGDFGAAAAAIIQREMQKAGDVTETTAQKTQRLNAEYKNLQAEIGEKLTPAYVGLLEASNGVLAQFSALGSENLSVWQKIQVLTGQISTGGILAMDKALEEYNDEQARMLQQYRSAEEEYAKRNKAQKQEAATIDSLNAKIKEYKEQLGHTSSEDEYLSVSGKIALVQERIDKITGEAVERMRAYRNAIKEVMQEIEQGAQQSFAEIFADDPEIKLKTSDLIDIDIEEEAPEIVEGYEELYAKIKEKGFESTKEYFDFQKQQSQEAADYLYNSFKNVLGDITGIQRQQIQQETNERLNALRIDEEAEKTNLKLKLEAGIISKEEFEKQSLAIDEKYSAKQASIKRQEAEQNKKLAKAEAVIQGALAAVEALPNLFLVGAVAAVTAAKIAVINNQPIPQFFDGTDYVSPQNAMQGRKRDDIPAMLNKGEAVITTQRNAEAKGLAQAWNEGNLDKWIYRQYNIPELRSKARNNAIEEQSDFARNIANSLTQNFEQDGIIRGLKKLGYRGSKDTDRIIKALSSNRRNMIS
jgi:hypothetical protein